MFGRSVRACAIGTASVRPWSGRRDGLRENINNTTKPPDDPFFPIVFRVEKAIGKRVAETRALEIRRLQRVSSAVRFRFAIGFRNRRAKSNGGHERDDHRTYFITRVCVRTRNDDNSRARKI